MSRQDAFREANWIALKACGAVLVVLALLVLVGTFPGKHGVGPIVPALVPVFGTLFAVAFALAQLAIAGWMGSGKALAVALGGLALGLAIAALSLQWLDFARYLRLGWELEAIRLRHLACGGSCVSALILGVMMWRLDLP